MSPLRYAAVTPARNEAANLQRLADSLLAQTLAPAAWVIVDDGSVDETLELARSLERRYSWISALCLAPPDGPLELGRREGRDVVAFSAGVDTLDAAPDVVVKLDADVSLPPEFFQRLLAEFVVRPRLGIASGVCYEEEGTTWREQPATGAHSRGATRAYRRECLEDVRPLVCRLGWDGIDELEAGLKGWETGTVRELPFFHHRRLAEREGRRRDAWTAQGRAAHFVGYRPSYLFARALFRARREPAALAMIWGYAGAALRGEPQYANTAARHALRSTQRLSELPRRSREARSRRTLSGARGASE